MNRKADAPADESQAGPPADQPTGSPPGGGRWAWTAVGWAALPDTDDSAPPPATPPTED